MLNFKPQHIRRASLATKLFPKLRSSLGLDVTKLISSEQFDGELFCGGRSKNRDLLTFFGCITECRGSSTFAHLPIFRRSLKKLTNLIETELELIGGQEVLLPTLIPQKLWIESKRLERQQDALKYVYKFTDNNGSDLLLGPTYEETITQIVAVQERLFESDMPMLLYQTSPKFRFEANPKFGLIRSNEFIMNDSYSFDADMERATQTYESVSRVYENLFRKLNLPCNKIESVTGNIGGKYSHEYQLKLSSGEDLVITCEKCHFAFNSELSKGNSNRCHKCNSTDLIKHHALELGHTFLLGDTYAEPLRAKFTCQTSNKRSNIQMGCYGLGLTRIIGAGVDLLSRIPSSCNTSSLLQLRWPRNIEPFKLGLVLPAKRSKQYHMDSTEFSQTLVNDILDQTKSVDIMVEDRDKEGLGKRIFRLQSLGLPYIIIIGQKFLEDPPQLELMVLNQQTMAYEQIWLTQHQLYDYIKKIDSELC